MIRVKKIPILEQNKCCIELRKLTSKLEDKVKDPFYNEDYNSLIELEEAVQSWDVKKIWKIYWKLPYYLQKRMPAPIKELIIDIRKQLNKH
jgi:hypothetical protein